MKNLKHFYLFVILTSWSITGNAQFSGCTNPFSCNYSPTAIFDDGSCCFNTCYTLEVTGGTDPAEVYWEFRDQFGNVFGNGGAGTYDLCLLSSCYNIFLYDSGGDGWEGATYSLTDSGGNVESTGTLGTGFEAQYIVNLSGFFCIGNGLYGCTIPYACNYDPNAVVLDPDACEFPGCTDEGACNFSPDAGCDDGSCAYDDEACSGFCSNLLGIRPGFVGNYTPDEWFPSFFNYGSGSSYQNEANMLLIGSNNYLGSSGSYQTERSVTLDATGFYSFTWSYTTTDSPANDPAYYKISGSETVVTTGASNDQNSTTTFYAQEGDTFTLGVRTENNSGGNAKFLVHNFRAPALPCGCTDPDAPNFDSTAVADDGSCCYDTYLNLTIFQPSGNLNEAGWAIRKSDNTLILEGEGGYSGSLCLGEGCYIMHMTDEGEDGWEGGFWNVTDQDGNTLNSGGMLESFAYTTETFVVLGEASGCSIAGCMDPGACNYRPNATIPTDDCCYEGCVQLTSPYPFGAIVSDLNSGDEFYMWEYNCPSYQPEFGADYVYFRNFCLPEEGCFELSLVSQDFNQTDYDFVQLSHADGTWINTYLLPAFEDEITHILKPNGVCTGCMMHDACNYIPEAEDAGSVAYCDFPGCDDPSAVNYSPNNSCPADNSTCMYGPHDCANGYNNPAYPGMNFGITGLMSSYPTQEVNTPVWAWIPHGQSLPIFEFEYIGQICNAFGGTPENPVYERFGKGGIDFNGTLSFDYSVHIGAGTGDKAFIVLNEDSTLLNAGTGNLTLDIQVGSFFALVFERTVHGGPQTSIPNSSMLLSNIVWTRHENCGCMHELACNYDPSATANWDGFSAYVSPCEYPNGCGDSSALNYNPDAICTTNACHYLSDCGALVNLDGQEIGLPMSVSAENWSTSPGNGANEIVLNEKEILMHLNISGLESDECSATTIAEADITLVFDWEMPISPAIGWTGAIRPEYLPFYEVNGIRTQIYPTSIDPEFTYPKGSISVDLQAGDEFVLGFEFNNDPWEPPWGQPVEDMVRFYNFHSSSTDGLCLFGCIYELASNYDPMATHNDGSCLFTTASCPGDFDGNLTINSADLLMFLAAFGGTCL